MNVLFVIIDNSGSVHTFVNRLLCRTTNSIKTIHVHFTLWILLQSPTTSTNLGPCCACDKDAAFLQWTALYQSRWQLSTTCDDRLYLSFLHFWTGNYYHGAHNIQYTLQYQQHNYFLFFFIWK